MGVFSNSLKVNKNNKNLKIAIITSEWNSTITNNLLSETIETLLKFGVKKTNISNYKVPGSFELIYASKRIAKNKEINAIITIGCIIKGPKVVDSLQHQDAVAECQAKEVAADRFVTHTRSWVQNPYFQADPQYAK